MATANDALALHAADVGISVVDSATDVAKEAADLALLEHNSAPCMTS